MKKTVKRKRLNIKRTLFFLLLFYIIGYAIYYFINQPIKHIYITGNNNIKDSEIITLAKIKDYPSIFEYSNKTIKNNIKKHKLIRDVKVKKILPSTIKIEVNESKFLFYHLNNKKIVLSNGNIIKNSFNVLGIPTLINNVESSKLNKFIENFSKIKENIIYEMNEIEYYPSYNEDGTLIMDDRYKITMNDGNTIITNSKNVDVLNKYNDIYASLGDKKGTINLDSDKITNLIFIPYGE